MQFDKSKVYTALNADELKIGSKVLVADTIGNLKDLVKSDEDPAMLAEIDNDYIAYRFRCEDDQQEYALAYLIEPPTEPKYKPFPDNETALKIIVAHGGWIKQGNRYYHITGLDIGCANGNEIKILHDWYSAKYVFENFVFVESGLPVGVKIEDDADENNEANGEA